MVDILNVHFAKRGYPQIRVGIGMAYGQVLMIKAGQKSSGVNEVAWVGIHGAEEQIPRASKADGGNHGDQRTRHKGIS